MLALINSLTSNWFWVLRFKYALLNVLAIKASSAGCYLTSERSGLFLICFLSINKISHISFDHSRFLFHSRPNSADGIFVLSEKPLKEFKNSSDLTMRKIDNLKLQIKATLMLTHRSIWLIAVRRSLKFFSFSRGNFGYFLSLAILIILGYNLSKI